jgi:predicted nucleic acid-binding protein
MTAHRILRQMARYVVDARALLRIASSGLRIHPDHQLVAPNAVRLEAMSLLYEQVRGGELTEDEALRLHERLTEVKLRLLGDRVSRRTAWRIAREHGWDAIGDAEYLAVTLLQADALIALDEALVGRANGIVPLAPLDALVSRGGA